MRMITDFVTSVIQNAETSGLCRTAPDDVERASGQQEIQPLVSIILLHQAHHAVREKTQPCDCAATELGWKGTNQIIH